MPGNVNISNSTLKHLLALIYTHSIGVYCVHEVSSLEDKYGLWTT